MSVIISPKDQTICHCSTASNNQTKQKVANFYNFLCISLENANTDRLKLAHRQWTQLKNSNVIMPKIINEVFNTYDGSKETLNTFLHKCEQHAFNIKKVCLEFLSNEPNFS